MLWNQRIDGNFQITYPNVARHECIPLQTLTLTLNVSHDFGMRMMSQNKPGPSCVASQEFDVIVEALAVYLWLE